MVTFDVFGVLFFVGLVDHVLKVSMSGHFSVKKILFVLVSEIKIFSK